MVSRILLGARQDEAEYRRTLAHRAALIQSFNLRLSGVEALAFPTVAVKPPLFEEVSESAEYDRLNRLVLRNTMTTNLLDGCAITLPALVEDGIGFMLTAATGRDAELLALAGQVETVLNQARDRVGS